MRVATIEGRDPFFMSVQKVRFLAVSNHHFRGLGNGRHIERGKFA